MVELDLEIGFLVAVEVGFNHRRCVALVDQDVEISGIGADALGASRIGVPNFEVAQKLVAESVLVSDDAVRQAQRALWEELRVIAEPAGATGLAALMSGAYKRAAGERVATLICGANTDPGSIV